MGKIRQPFEFVPPGDRQRLAAMAAQQQRARSRLYRLAANQRKAREIRDLALFLVQRMAAECNDALLPAIRTWRQEALAEADRLDPALIPRPALVANK